jgi:hypothetical protein
MNKLYIFLSLLAALAALLTLSGCDYITGGYAAWTASGLPIEK